MKQSGMITGGVAFLFAFGAAVTISPLCVPCLTLLFGLLGGYLAGVFERPFAQNPSLKAGALAGLIGGTGMLLGQIFGAVINGIAVGPEGAARLLAQMELFAGSPVKIAEYYWTVLALSTACLGIFDLALTSGFGTLGGLLWWKIRGEKQVASNGVIEI